MCNDLEQQFMAKLGGLPIEEVEITQPAPKGKGRSKNQASHALPTSNSLNRAASVGKSINATSNPASPADLSKESLNQISAGTALPAAASDLDITTLNQTLPIKVSGLV